MPYTDIGDDGVVGGYEMVCDRCGWVGATEGRALDVVSFWNYEIFRSRKKPDLGVFCYDCCKAITPLVWALRDIDELQYFVNNLKRAINERRSKVRGKDDGAASHHARQRSEGRAEWRHGH
jgi:hypothetical protein